MKITIKLFAVLLTVISTATFAAGSEKDPENEQAIIRILPGSEIYVRTFTFDETVFPS